MGLLDKFTILFETDSKESSEQVNKLNQTLDQTEKSADGATSGVDASGAAAAAAATQFSGFAETAAGLIAAYVSLAAIKTTLIDTAFRVDTIGKFSETLGYSIVEIDAWGAAVERNGGSAESFRSSIQALDSQMQDMALGGGTEIAQTLGMMGISAMNASGGMKSVFDLLPQIADSMEGMSKQRSFQLGQRLGLDQGTILTLQQGRAAVDDLVEQQRQLGGMTEESYKASAAFNDEMDNTGRVFDGLWQMINVKILPIFTDLLKGIQGVVMWMREHEEFSKAFFITMATAITAYALPAMYRLAAATIAATWPFLAVAAAIAGISFVLAVLYEDVVAYIGGQESFIGKLLDKYEWLRKGVEFVVERMKKALDDFKNRLDWVQLLFNEPMAALDQLWQGFVNLWEDVKNLFDFASLMEDIELNPLKWGSDNGEGLFDGVELNPFKWGSEDVGRNTQAGIEAHSAYAATPVGFMGRPAASVVSNRTSNVNVGGVSVDARGMDQNQARGLINDRFTDELARAAGQYDDGVDY